MIYLLRHTKPDIESGICYGNTDLGLDPESSKSDTAKAIKSLEVKHFKTIYSSPLKRCTQLAKEVVNQTQQCDTVTVDPRLKELNFGDWEMMRWDDIFLSTEGKEWFDNYIEHPTPNGESFAELIGRAKSFLDEMMTETEDDILIVTHSGFIRGALVAMNIATPSEAFDKKIEYGELVKLEI
ncbi:MAG: alpha-ribazole phosphatase family protein [Rikenellaceae bacterium]